MCLLTPLTTSSTSCRLCAVPPNILLERADPRTVVTSTRQRQRGASAAGLSNICENLVLTKEQTESNTNFSENKSRHAKYAANSAANMYKTRKTKFCVFLLIFLCAILSQTSYAIPVTSSGQRLILHTSQYRQRHHQNLLQEHRSRAPAPTPHRHHLQHRSVNNMPDTNLLASATTNGNSNSNCNKYNGNNSYNDANYYCQRVVKELKKTQKQANATFNTIRGYLGEYTKQQFNKTPEVLHEEWQKHFLQLVHPYSQSLLRDFSVMPDQTHFQSLLDGPISRQTLITEMQNVYTTLKTLDNVFSEVIAYRTLNKDRLLHDLNNNRELFDSINKFFEQAQQHVGYDLRETEEAMCKLAIPLPQVGPAVYNRDAPVREWLLAEEHLSVMQYLRALYAILVSKCAQ